MGLTVCLVGRANVGKSTLFNRLVGARLAIVDDTPGVTRDRRVGDGKIADLKFTVIDTAGLEQGSQQGSQQGSEQPRKQPLDNSLQSRMQYQTRLAIADADVALMMIDARTGITPFDTHFAQFLRKQNTPIILVANKCEKKDTLSEIADAYALGLGEVIAISAEHGQGMGDLYDAIRPYHFDSESDGHTFVDRGVDADDDIVLSRPLQMAIVGRPNVGKSTLVNSYVGADRMLTGPEAGITRDSIACAFELFDRKIRLVDTAGLRKRSRILEKIEKLATADSIRTVRFAQVVVLLIDTQQGLEKQDLSIADTVIAEGRALVIGANKWDMVTDKQNTLHTINQRVQTSLPQVRGVQIVPLSALSGHNTERLMRAVFDAFDVWNIRIPTAKLNNWLRYKTEQHPPPLVNGRRLKIRYISQIKTRPPTFYINASHPDGMPQSYIRYLAQGLRQDFDLWGVPLRLLLRKSKNPYTKK